MFTKIKQFFKPFFMTNEERIERYLSESVSLVDLEMRQRELQRTGFKY